MIAPQLRLDAAIDRHGPELAAIGREAIRAAMAAMPTANRVIDEAGGLLRVHFLPGTRLSDAIVTVSFHGYWISYDFPHGRLMYDLDELLRRSDRDTYHYVIEGPGDVGDMEVRHLLDDAVHRAPRPPNPENRARLYTIEELP